MILRIGMFFEIQDFFLKIGTFLDKIPLEQLVLCLVSVSNIRQEPDHKLDSPVPKNN